MDNEIRKLRRELWSARTDEEAYLKLEAIDKLQRQRKVLIGEFLPDRNGKVYYYDCELSRWFQYREGIL
jgi:hypothetical protein